MSRKLYAQLPELSQLLDRTLARAPKEEYGPPPGSLWHRLVVSQLNPELALGARACQASLEAAVLSAWSLQLQQMRVARPPPASGICLWQVTPTTPRSWQFLLR